MVREMPLQDVFFPMKKLYLYIFILLYAADTIAQKHDNLWIHIAPGYILGQFHISPPISGNIYGF